MAERSPFRADCPLSEDTAGDSPQRRKIFLLLGPRLHSLHQKTRQLALRFPFACRCESKPHVDIVSPYM